MTNIASWYLEFKSNKIKLYHRNPGYPMKSYRHGSLRGDYHEQKVWCKNLETYLEYIYCHDIKYLVGYNGGSRKVK